MRLLVCGGRKYADRKTVFDILDAWHDKRPITVIITGMAKGADTFAWEWAKARGIETDEYPITKMHWRMYAYGAGPIRNGEMLQCGKPDAVLAFPGNTGTLDMCNKARLAGIEPFLYGHAGLLEGTING